MDFFNNFITKFGELLAKSTLPSKSDGIAFRSRLLDSMIKKKYAHYFKQFEKLNKDIDEIFANPNSDSELLDDYLWLKKGFVNRLNGVEQTWWAQEEPWMIDVFNKSSFEKAATRRDTQQSQERVAREKSAKLVADSLTSNTLTQQKVVFTSLLSTYFLTNKRTWPIRQQMIYAYQNVDPKRVSNSILGAGPIMLKILQQVSTAIGTEIVPGVYKDIPNLTPQEFEKTVKAFGLSKDVEAETLANPKVLGSASLAQAHFTTVNVRDYDEDGKPFNEEVKAVIKFIKPFQIFNLMVELKFMCAVTWIQISSVAKEIYGGGDRMVIESRQLFLFFLKSFIEELDYCQEGSFTIAGYQKYEQGIKGNLHSAMLLENEISTLPYMITTLARGESFQNTLEALELLDYNDPMNVKKAEYYQKLASDVYSKWMTTALFSSGFFHADLHPGNIYMPKIETLNFNSETDQYESPDGAYVIDYGSSGKLVKRQRCGVLLTNVSAAKIKNLFLLLDELPESNTAVTAEKIKMVSKLFPDYKGNYDSLVRKFYSSKAQKIHSKNLKYSREFVQTFFKMCNLNPQKGDAIRVASEILSYPKELHYGVFVVKLAEVYPLEQCGRNEIISFGRGFGMITGVAFSIPKITSKVKVTNILEILKQYFTSDVDFKKAKQVSKLALGLPLCKI